MCGAQIAVKRGAVSVKAPHELKDEHGSVTLATIQTYGECTHTFVERAHYTGVFMPGYRASAEAVRERARRVRRRLVSPAAAAAAAAANRIRSRR